MVLLYSCAHGRRGEGEAIAVGTKRTEKDTGRRERVSVDKGCQIIVLFSCPDRSNQKIE